MMMQQMPAARDKSNDDCYFYYYSTCRKGTDCPFRHCEAALGTETVCSLWKEGRCFRKVCKFRHMESQVKRSRIPCFWETQESGCLKPHCVFMHHKPRTSLAEALQEKPQGFILPVSSQAQQQPVNMAPNPMGMETAVMVDGATAAEEQIRVDSGPVPSVTAVVEPVVVSFDEDSNDAADMGNKMCDESVQDNRNSESVDQVEEVKMPENNVVDLRCHLQLKRGLSNSSENLGPPKKRLMFLKKDFGREGPTGDFRVKTLAEIKQEKNATKKELEKLDESSYLKPYPNNEDIKMALLSNQKGMGRKVRVLKRIKLQEDISYEDEAKRTSSVQECNATELSYEDSPEVNENSSKERLAVNTEDDESKGIMAMESSGVDETNSVTEGPPFSEDGESKDITAMESPGVDQIDSVTERAPLSYDDESKGILAMESSGVDQTDSVTERAPLSANPRPSAGEDELELLLLNAESSELESSVEPKGDDDLLEELDKMINSE